MKRTRMMLAKIVLTVIAGYVIVVAMIAVTQTGVIFPAGVADRQAPVLPPDAMRLEMTTPDGARLVGTRFRPRRPAEDAGIAILGFGGNATNADDLALYLRTLYPQAEVVTFNYRGYRPSTGRPSAEALLEDALLVHDLMRRTVGRRPIVAIGMSLGSGIAAYVAKHRDLAGLILVTPFDSLINVARDHYPWAPVALLLRHRIPTADFARGRNTPTAMIYSQRDGIVPPRRAEALRPAIRNLVFERKIPDTGHNDVYGHKVFQEAMVEALNRLTPYR